MQKEDKISEKESLEYLSQLIKTLDEAIIKLEIYHEKKDSVNFDKMKGFIAKILVKINEIVS